MTDSLEDEDPVDGLCRVEDLEPVVGREDQVAVAQDVKVATSYERNLKFFFEQLKTNFWL